MAQSCRVPASYNQDRTITMASMSDALRTKLNLWMDFLTTHRVAEDSVPLFATEDEVVATMDYGRNGRRVLKRSPEMDALMRRLGGELIAEFRACQVIHDGILYMMFRRETGGVIPLYFGKAEIYGKGDANLSANVSDLATGDGKFGRWGYNYAYHIGDLSAVTLPGHPAARKTRKYTSWRRAIFIESSDSVQLNGDVRFWACLWGPDKQSIWGEYGTTRLAFEEYLLIGVASDLFPNDLLNREGRNKLELNKTRRDR